MGTNFNVGSFNAINTNETKDKKTSSSHSVNDDLKKRLLIFGGVIVIGVVLIAHFPQVQMDSCH